MSRGWHKIYQYGRTQLKMQRLCKVIEGGAKAETLGLGSVRNPLKFRQRPNPPEFP